MSQDASARTITVRYFASIREVMGTGSETLSTTAATVGELREALRAAKGNAAAQALAPTKAVRMALNQDMCKVDAVLKEGDEVAFFPPVTGG